MGAGDVRLQLGAFEVRLNGRGTKINGEPSKPISPGTAFARQVIGAMKDRPLPYRAANRGTDCELAGVSSGINPCRTVAGPTVKSIAIFRRNAPEASREVIDNYCAAVVFCLR
jgi:hypothetical protein